MPRAGAGAALHAAGRAFAIPEEQLALCTIGHSLGAAVALDFAAHHRAQCILTIAPFTTLREEAATVVGLPLSRLLLENCDNRETLARNREAKSGARIAIFHGVRRSCHSYTTWVANSRGNFHPLNFSRSTAPVT